MKENRIQLWVWLPAFLLMAGCATVYTANDFDQYQREHRSVAILPFDVNVDLRKLPEGMTREDLEAMEEEEGYLFQDQLYANFLMKHQKSAYTIDFQDIDKTNVMLQRADVDYQSLRKYTKEELAEILGVDAIISGRIYREKPMNMGEAIFSTFLVGNSVTNEVDINMTVHDGKTGNLLFSYDHQVQGSLGSSAENLARSLMNEISNKFPYKTSN
jgi:hypothetical protein